ncbi:MAG: aminopeptidase P family protein [Candidatus Heimdallarchaeota archaeon]|nr:aminopeptidase P family protein [Candidatus Heimdallarchaeota archaeon]MCK4770322.1 aminopeptidase P family protein [Candidatus Heimdallarchaeota archaeon]
MNKYAISKENQKKRIGKIQNFCKNNDLGSMIFFSPLSIYYLTGYHFIPTERPIAFVLPALDDPWFFVPRLEKEHLMEKIPWIHRELYFEYPDEKHPAKIFVDKLVENKITNLKIGMEAPSFSNYWGYEGPKLTDLIGNKAKTEIHSSLIPQIRKIKDKEELNLIRISAKYGDLAHRLLQEYTAEGKNEVDVSLQASMEASKKMLEDLEGFIPRSFLPAGAGYRGQIGEWSAIPHSVLQKTAFKKGDVLVTGASANISGYLSELERTMFIGKPSDKQRRYFNVMKKAQDAALEAFKPGIPCSAVDKAAIAVFKEEGLKNLTQHHTGHAIGLEGHEAPFLDIGVDEIMKPGMVLTCEPGIYEYKFGGFRHSETVIITEDGSDHITPYPRELEDLII